VKLLVGKFSLLSYR